MKANITKKRFYGKWLYKVQLRCPGVSALRTAHITDLLKIINDPIITKKSWLRQPQYHSFRKLVNLLDSYDQADWQKRVENVWLDIYTNNLELYNDLKTDLKPNVVLFYEPDPATIHLLDKKFNIIVNQYPHQKYQYRVYLQPHKLKSDIAAKHKFIDWIFNQKDKICCTKSVGKWFINTSWNWDRRYILVDNEQTLLMLKMRQGNAIGRVYNYVLTDK